MAATCLAAAALAVAACTAGVPSSSSSVTLPDRLPIPAGASVDVGSGSLGYDLGHPFVGFTSPLAPAAARAEYDSALTSAGFVIAGTSGSWRLYASATGMIAVRVDEVGPPTSIIVQLKAPSPTFAAGASAAPSAGAVPSAAAAVSPAPKLPDPPHATPAPGTPSSPPGQGNKPSSPPGQGNKPSSPPGQSKGK